MRRVRQAWRKAWSRTRRPGDLARRVGKVSEDLLPPLSDPLLDNRIHHRPAQVPVRKRYMPNEAYERALGLWPQFVGILMTIRGSPIQTRMSAPASPCQTWDVVCRAS